MACGGPSRLTTVGGTAIGCAPRQAIWVARWTVSILIERVYYQDGDHGEGHREGREHPVHHLSSEKQMPSST